MKTLLNYSFLFLLLLLFGCPPTPRVVDDLPKGDLENLCNNFKKDPGEVGIDCGGNCPNCEQVIIPNELLIRHLAVVESPMAKTGTLSFGQIMSRLSANERETKDLILSFLQTWEKDQVTNGITVPARPPISSNIIRMWKQRDSVDIDTPLEAWDMNLENAPFRLLAITNRVDLQNFDHKSAGEGRLTFGLAHGGSNDFTLIFEFNLAGKTEQDVLQWAKKWHELSTLDLNSEAYLRKLESIVLSFTSKPSDLNQLRTNEGINGIFDGTFNWEMRELNIRNNRFVEVTRKQSPNMGLNNSQILSDYLKKHQDEILAENHVIKADFEGNRFLAGTTAYDRDFTWSAPGFDDNSLIMKRINALSCSGCHGGLAKHTEFTHIKPRAKGKVADISRFLEVDLVHRRATLMETLGFDPPANPMQALSRNLQGAEMMELKVLFEDIKGVKRVH